MATAPCSQYSAQEERIDSVCLLSWGANSYGQLGQGHADDQPMPKEAVTTNGIGSPQIMTGGGGHTLVVAGDGSLWVCGSNLYGQLALGNNQHVDLLTQVLFPLPIQIAQVSGGWDFTVACTRDGELYTWGNNAFQQLGRDTAEKFSALPEKIKLCADSPVLHVAAGLRHGLALTADGSVHGWGQNKKGQLGQVTNDEGIVFKAVRHPVKLNFQMHGKITQLIAGAYHSGSLSDLQSVYLWGCNKYGQLGQDPAVSLQMMQPFCLSSLKFGGQQIKCIAAGWTHNLILTESGQVYSWGRADYGQLGRPCNGSFDHLPGPVANIKGAHSIACGSEHNLVLTDEGKLVSWGWNEHGMCGTGDEHNVFLPTHVTLYAKPIISVGCGAGHSFALVNR